MKKFIFNENESRTAQSFKLVNPDNRQEHNLITLAGQTEIDVTKNLDTDYTEILNEFPFLKLVVKNEVESKLPVKEEIKEEVKEKSSKPKKA